MRIQCYSKTTISITVSHDSFRSLSHPNIVTYLGFYQDKQDRKYIVMEYLPLGSVNKVVSDESGKIQIVDLLSMYVNG